MAKLILDKNLASEVEISVDTMYERIVDNTMNAVKSIKIEAGQPLPVIPELDSRDFTTVNLETDGGVAIPVVCSYNKVLGFQTQYYDADKMFSYSIDLGYVVE